MWKKTFIRLSFIGLVVLATLVVFASTSNRPIERDTDADECTSTSSQKEGCEKKAQADFILWESLSKTIMSSVSY